jgi:hypothetical protein
VGIAKAVAPVLAPPDLDLELNLDPHAPSEARHAVSQVDRPSPDLRDAVRLLTSELVTRALRHKTEAEASTIELRVWMPREIVRVEVWASSHLLHGRLDEPGAEFDLMLLDEASDRWAIDDRGERSCAWFEIDRSPPAHPSASPRPRGGRQPAHH